MTIDVPSVQLALVVVAATMLVLFYVVTFRSTRSEYCAWWCLALLLFIAGSAAYLLDGTSQQWWANPAGSMLLVGGAVSTWAGARSLRTTRPRMWQLLLAPAIVGVAASLDTPSTNTWAGGGFYLLMMSLMLGLGALEMRRVDVGFSATTTAVAVAAAVACSFYLFRWVAYLAVGPDGDFFVTFAGSGLVTLINMMLMVTVSYSMTALGNDQLTADLRRRATLDGLTGLLNRSEFMNLATIEIRRLQRTNTPASLVIADLDHFKDINDAGGHQGGDLVLTHFAAASLETVRSTDLVGRLGGDEFVLLLAGSSVEHAARLTDAISARLQMSTSPLGGRAPTVSYGIAPVSTKAQLGDVVTAADQALYEAKRAGRNGFFIAVNPMPDAV